MGANSSQPEFFREEQGFRSAWLRPVLLGISALLIVLFGWGLYQQIILHQPWGDRPMSDTGLVVLSIVMFALPFALPFFFLRSKLVVTVDREVVRVSLVPFARRSVPITEIAQAQPRKCNPLREFGGVGVRWTPNGWAYLVAGDMGVQLLLVNGKRIFVGSQRPDELAAAIATAKTAG